MFKNLGRNRGKDNPLLKQTSYMADPFLRVLPHLANTETKTHALLAPLVPELCQPLHYCIDFILWKPPSFLVLNEPLGRFNF